MDLDVRKFYVRHREQYPETEIQDHARRGFWALGAEVVPYFGFGDIDLMEDLGPEVGLSGYIGDIHQGLRRIGRPMPESVDYPEPLRDFLRRGIQKTVMREVRRSPERRFVKPVEQKLFTGLVWDFEKSTRLKLAHVPDDAPVWISEVIRLESEYRVFILDNEILDCRLYKGDWSMAPSKTDVKEMVDAMAPTAPRAYCLDVGVASWSGYLQSRTQTVLVEMNDGFAMGHYGLRPELYARMLSARWSEMAK